MAGVVSDWLHVGRSGICGSVSVLAGINELRVVHRVVLKFLKIEAVNLLETLVNTCRTARCYIPEDVYVGSHCCWAGSRYVGLGQGR